MKAVLVHLLFLFYLSAASGNRCPHLSVYDADPPYGTCDRYPLSPGARCTFKCREGYKLTGSTQRVCQKDSSWSGQRTSCDVIRCPKLSLPSVGVLIPEYCKENKPKVFSMCEIRCPRGYIIPGDGNHRTICSLSGTWTKSLSRCIDIARPRLLCPRLNPVHTLPGKSYALVSWKESITDNSQHAHDPNAAVTVTSSHKSSQQFPIGETRVKITAIDASGNKAECGFEIRVVDVEPPMVVRCPGDIVIETTDHIKRVFWDNPIFTDNSGLPPVIVASHRNGDMFSIGDTLVQYMATDQSGNAQKSCSFKVTLKAKSCPSYAPPRFGALVCYENALNAERFCMATCSNDYDFSFDPVLLYYCSTGSWRLWGSFIVGSQNRLPWPNCTKRTNPSAIKRIGFPYYYYSGNANDPNVQVDLKNKFIALTRSGYIPPPFCSSNPRCTVNNIKVYVGKQGRK